MSTAPTNAPTGFRGNPTPFDDFAPIGEDPDVLAAQALVTWLRKNGYAAHGIVVGKVQIVGLVDEFPHKQRENAAGAAGPQFGFPRHERK